MIILCMRKPLAEILRPQSCDEIIGQDHLCGKEGILRTIFEKGTLFSFILWGDPGSGKTSIIEIFLKRIKEKTLKTTGSTFSAKEVKKYCEEAEKLYNFNGETSVVFVDEIHRLNKSQQDLFLPYVEKGTIILLGATTENPSFEVNKALLSRLKVFTLNSLSKEDVFKILEKALIYLKDKYNIEFEKGIKEFLYSINGSDVRSSLNSLDLIVRRGISGKISIEEIKDYLTESKAFYDKDGEYHYNIISAFHKSVRNSDIDSSLYWLARMLIAGEDRKYILRRIIRITAEDIGLADPAALSIAINSFKAFEIIGEPEGDIFLFYATVYITLAPKSNSLYTAEKKAKKFAKETSSLQPPLQIRNPVTKLMREEEYGNGYLYAHDFKEKTTIMKTLPEEIENIRIFFPENIGFEKEIIKRYEYWKKLKEKLRDKAKINKNS